MRNFYFPLLVARIKLFENLFKEIVDSGNKKASYNGVEIIKEDDRSYTFNISICSKETFDYILEYVNTDNITIDLNDVSFLEKINNIQNAAGRFQFQIERLDIICKVKKIEYTYMRLKEKVKNIEENIQNDLNTIEKKKEQLINNDKINTYNISKGYTNKALVEKIKNLIDEINKLELKIEIHKDKKKALLIVKRDMIIYDIPPSTWFDDINRLYDVFRVGKYGLADFKIYPVNSNIPVDCHLLIIATIPYFRNYLNFQKKTITNDNKKLWEMENVEFSYDVVNTVIEYIYKRDTSVLTNENILNVWKYSNLIIFDELNEEIKSKVYKSIIALDIDSKDDFEIIKYVYRMASAYNCDKITDYLLYKYYNYVDKSDGYPFRDFLIKRARIGKDDLLEFINIHIS